MTEREKAKIISMRENGMTFAQIRQMTAVTVREFQLLLKEMKARGELPTTHKTLEDKIMEAYNRGERNPYKIADEYGATPNYVRYVFSINQLRVGKKTQNWVHCERTNAIVEDLQGGELTNAQIARKFGVSRQYITNIKRKLRERENDRPINEI